LPTGLPAVEILAYAPFKIVQTPGLTIVMYEADNTRRQIYTDGRKLPDDPQPSWLGYSVGRWEGDTLIVDSAGFNDKTPLDIFGHPHSEAMRIQERFRRRDFGHTDVQVTIEDPKVFTKPITVKFTLLLLPDTIFWSPTVTRMKRTGPTWRAHEREGDWFKTRASLGLRLPVKPKPGQWARRRPGGLPHLRTLRRRDAIQRAIYRKPA
jgi:hypothetical protein